MQKSTVRSERQEATTYQVPEALPRSVLTLRLQGIQVVGERMEGEINRELSAVPTGV